MSTPASDAPRSHSAAATIGYAHAALRHSRMRRRDFIAGLGSVVGSSTCGHAQSLTKHYRIGMLDTSARQLNPNFGALQQGLQERGYIEGQNLTFEYRSPD